MSAPVLAVVVCRDGESWLPGVLAALGEQSERPRRVLAVDTGSTDRTAELLAQARADQIVDDVLTLPPDTSFATAVADAVALGKRRWADPGRWLWLLDGASEPGPEQLADLLAAPDPSAVEVEPGKLIRRAAFERLERRPSPSPRENARGGFLSRGRFLRLLVSPLFVLFASLLAFALINALLTDRLGAGLAGGRLLPVADLATTWRDYLAAWHPVAGGTGSPASPSLLVLALLGSVLGGPSVVVSVLLLFGVPLAGLSAYFAARALPVPPLRRAIAAGAYALLPVASLSAGQGRLDVVVAHVLVPPLLAGIAAVLRRSGRQWLGTVCLTALGLAVLGAFAPLMHLALIVLALLAHVLLPGENARSRHRVVGLAALVLLSVACLLPWPVVLLQHPQVLLHGFGARAVEESAGAWMFALSPDGSAASLPGVLFVLAAAVALAVTRDKRMLPAVGVVIFGWLLAAAVDGSAAEPIAGGVATVGWTGGPLVLVAVGCGWIVLQAGRPKLPEVPQVVGIVALSAVVAALVTSSAIALAGGPLAPERPLAAPAGTRLVLDPGPQPARLITGTGPRFGDDDLAPAGSAAEWLRQVDDDLRSADPGPVREALAAVAARGAEFVVVPAGSRVPELGRDLVTEHERLPDGRRVLRVLLPSSPVKLVGPDLARQAQTEPEPAPEARPLPVAAQLPNFTVRVSEGGAGRALVLGAENEPGWYARVDGMAFPLATAWGHQVAIPLPEQAAEVQVGFTELPRTALLCVQAAAILFTLVAAIPGRRRKTST
ncbi:Glycosyl transferase family 2 [Saccharopolyspora antimicrobica]|uniref:Glycosyl transferase family 2 n=1 Tax=Saccharopolyspora antimicrobica TaxID=455193 RepID=A0A1I5LBX6_9PSEU|nr:glycosyltransferase family A protein [Saccharopolyspora antimicrobica]RKT85440.1 glycosyl transferase family 2 [Saccharopolyspora antimicrobica]SFO94780.1 Glycosyl transferase family 2 [Saccharopolyspora antimicrobica]